MKGFFSVILFCLSFGTPILRAQADCSHTATLLKILKEQHYNPLSYNDSVSSDIFDLTISYIDPNGFYFLKTDVERLELFRYQLEDDNFAIACDFMDSLSSLFYDRTQKVKTALFDFLNTPVDLFSKDVFKKFDDDSPYAESKDILDLKWQHSIRANIIADVYMRADTAEIANMPYLTELEKEIRESSLAKYQSRFDAIESREEIDQTVLSAFFNAISTRHDPHSVYLPPVSMQAFMDEVSTTKMAYGFSVDENDNQEIIVASILPGSPAWLSSKININDVILQVSFPGSDVVNLSNYTTRDLNMLLAQNDSDSLTLKLRKTSGKSLQVNLVKAEVEQESNQIEGYVLEGDKKIGYIYLPAFFTDWSTYDLQGCANDVAKELVKLKQESIDGLILDLRDNGGGSVKEAIELAGIFVDLGPMALIKSNSDDVDLMKDWYRGVAYSGPMVVLINNGSASASEVFAASMQDYNRALIVGGQSYGKSTGQSIYPLTDNYETLSTYNDHYDCTSGYLKVTKSKFYRLNKYTAQHVGVTPDVVFPDELVAFKNFEKDYKFAVLPDSVSKSLRFTPLAALPGAALQEKSSERINGHDGFMAIQLAEKAWADLLSTYHLNFNEYRKANAVEQKLLDDMDQAYEAHNSLYQAKINSFDEDVLLIDNYRKTATLSFLEALNSDIYLQETYNIINDLIQLKSK